MKNDDEPTTTRPGWSLDLDRWIRRNEAELARKQQFAPGMWIESAGELKARVVRSFVDFDLDAVPALLVDVTKVTRYFRIFIALSGIATSNGRLALNLAGRSMRSSVSSKFHVVHRTPNAGWGLTYNKPLVVPLGKSWIRLEGTIPTGDIQFEPALIWEFPTSAALSIAELSVEARDEPGAADAPVLSIRPLESWARLEDQVQKA